MTLFLIAAATAHSEVLWTRRTDESIYHHLSYSDGAFLLSNSNGPPVAAELMPAAKTAAPLWTWNSPLNKGRSPRNISIDGLVATASSSTARAGLALAYVDDKPGPGPFGNLNTVAIAVGFPGGSSTSNRTSFSYETKAPYGNVSRLALSPHHHVTCHELPGAPPRLLLRNATTGALIANTSLPPTIRQCSGEDGWYSYENMVAAANTAARPHNFTRVAIAPKLGNGRDPYPGVGLVIATQRGQDDTTDGSDNQMEMDDLSDWVTRDPNGKWVYALAIEPSGHWIAYADATGLKLVEPAGGGWSLPNLLWADAKPPAKGIPQAIGWAADGSVLGVAYAIDPNAGLVGPAWQNSVVVAYAWPPRIDSASGDPILHEIARHELECYAALTPFPSALHVTDGGEAVVVGLWGCTNGTGTGRDHPIGQTAVVLPLRGSLAGGRARVLGTNGTVFAVAARAEVRRRKPQPQSGADMGEDQEELELIVAVAGKRTHANEMGRGGFAEAWKLRL